jgi:nitrogen regulatory protein PII
MREIKAIIQPFLLEKVLHALGDIEELPGVTISEVTGWGRARGRDSRDTVRAGAHTLAKKTKLEIVVPDSLAPRVVEVILSSAHTGNPGDGKIFTVAVGDVRRIRTREAGEEAI